MKLSTIFELLLIFLIIAFAASKVTKSHHHRKAKQTSPNRYCECSNFTCTCCRDFSLPVVPIKGPGCATLKHIQGDTMQVTMKFGDRVLRNVTISGKRPSPICMSLPGGISKFCGRVYGIGREGDQVRACLGLELRALDDVEAALRLSCFNFGPKGLNLEPGRPVPTDEDDDDDDDDDDFGFPGDDDDEEDDDDDDVFGLGDDDDDDDENNAVSQDADADADYTGFTALSDDFLDSFFESDSSKKKKKPVVQSKPTVVKTKPVQPVQTLPPQRVYSTSKPVVSVYTTPKSEVPAYTTLKAAEPSVHSTQKPEIPIYATQKPEISIYSTQKTEISTFKRITTRPLVSFIQTFSTAIPMPQVKQTSPANQIPYERVRPSTSRRPVTHVYTRKPTTTTPADVTDGYIQVASVTGSASSYNNYKDLNTTKSTEPEEPVTSTSMSINVIQSIHESFDNNNDNSLPLTTVNENVVTEAPEYNEIDSNVKITEPEKTEITTEKIQTTKKVTSKLEDEENESEEEEEDEEDDGEEAVEEELLNDHKTVSLDSSEEIEHLNDQLKDQINQKPEQQTTINDTVDDQEDDSDEFRSLKQPSSTTPVFRSARQHRRMRLPPMFS